MATKDTITEDDDQKPGAEGDELVITEVDPAAAAKPSDNDDDTDDRAPKHDDGDDGHADSDDREAIRERRRKEKIERKGRRDAAINRDKIELDFLRKQNEQLERRMASQEQRTHNNDLSAVDQQIAAAKGEVELAERVIAKAVEAGNGEDVTRAMRYRDEARQKAAELAAYKQRASVQAAPAQPGIDSRTMTHAQEFLSDNRWYDPQGRDEDSAVVLAIDQALAREGFDPTTEDYWDELRDRAARRIPERFARTSKADADSAAEKRPARGGPAVGSGREHAPTSTRREVYISPERKQALIEAGVWDDPMLRMRYVKRYAEFDRQNRS